MKIVCGQHSKPAKYVCGLAGCKVTNLLCEDCVSQNLPHTQSHKHYILSLQEFARLCSAKGVCESSKELLEAFDKFDARLAEAHLRAEEAARATEAELSALRKVVEVEIKVLLHRLSKAASAPLAKFQALSKELKASVADFGAKKEKETSFFSFFSDDKEQPEN
jgi:hypothetical protein